MSLNEDAYNIRAERYALCRCMRDAEVGQVWSEQDMVFSFGGCMVPGTPDGMFEDVTGGTARLKCVQVVRMPLHPLRTPARAVSRIVFDTVLTKVVKSMHFMRSTKVLPEDFVIFCWLHPGMRAAGLVAGLARARRLIRRVRKEGWPFSLRVALAGEELQIFPEHFASSGRDRAACTELLAFRAEDFESDEEDDFYLPDIFEEDSESDWTERESNDGGNEEESMEEEEEEEDNGASTFVGKGGYIPTGIAVQRTASASKLMAGRYPRPLCRRCLLLAAVQQQHDAAAHDSMGDRFWDDFMFASDARGSAALARNVSECAFAGWRITARSIRMYSSTATISRLGK